MKAKILSASLTNITLAAKHLREGNVVGIPTETVYGLAGLAFNEDALMRIFKTKERPTFDPLIIHVAMIKQNQSALKHLVRSELVQDSKLSDSAKRAVELLTKKFWPGPLTLVLPKNPKVPDLVTSGLPTVAIRMPRNGVAQALLAEVGTPLAAPSANRFGKISPTTAEAVAKELGDKIDFILDGGPCEIGLESSVVAIQEDGSGILLRPGGIPKEEIEKTLENSLFYPQQISQKNRKKSSQGQASPGLLENHYAPNKPLKILPKRVDLLSAEEFKKAASDALAKRSKIGLLVFSGDVEKVELTVSAWTGCKITVRSLTASLSTEFSTDEAAKNLFSQMRALDESDVEFLFTEPCESKEGLGFAIADRLQKAAVK